MVVQSVVESDHRSVDSLDDRKVVGMVAWLEFSLVVEMVGRLAG